MPSIAGINIWRHVGYTALLIFAGLQTIPKDVYEAGAIDGATETRMFWSITIPLLRPVLVFVLVTTVIGSFQIFDTIAITTKGGPVNATRVIYWYIYEFAFSRFQMGYATAVAVVLFLILITITIITATAITPSTTFHAGRFPHDILKADSIWLQDQAHSFSIVRNTQVTPCNMTCNN